MRRANSNTAWQSSQAATTPCPCRCHQWGSKPWVVRPHAAANNDRYILPVKRTIPYRTELRQLFADPKPPPSALGPPWELFAGAIAVLIAVGAASRHFWSRSHTSKQATPAATAQPPSATASTQHPAQFRALTLLSQQRASPPAPGKQQQAATQTSAPDSLQTATGLSTHAATQERPTELLATASQLPDSVPTEQELLRRGVQQLGETVASLVASPDSLRDTAQAQGQLLAAAIGQQLFDPGVDLGRVVLVARRPPTTEPFTMQQDYFSQFVRSGRVRPAGGLLINYPTAALLVLEGGNHQVLALLRRLMWDGSEKSGLDQIRVVSFVLDARTRLFPTWLAVDVKAGGRSELGVTIMSDQEWATAIRTLDTFVRMAGSRLLGLSESSQNQVLRDPMLFFGDLTPSPQHLLSLLASELAPDLDKFLSAYDSDWPRYCSAREDIAEAEGPPELLSALPSWKGLHAVYGALYDEHQQKHAASQASDLTPSPLAHLYPQAKAAGAQR